MLVGRITKHDLTYQGMRYIKKDMYSVQVVMTFHMHAAKIVTFLLYFAGLRACTGHKCNCSNINHCSTLAD